MKCKGCGRVVKELNDEDMCSKCQDKWLDDILKKNPEVMSLVRLNEFKEDIDLGGN